MKESSKDKDLPVRVRDKDEGRKSKENGASSSSKGKDEGPSPGSKRRRSESPKSPIESRDKLEVENTSEQVCPFDVNLGGYPKYADRAMCS